ncbi:MAG: T4SS efffector SepA family protein [Hyphomicrobiaceae bacterium]
MPSVELSEATFKRLQAHAKPLIDTPSTVIDRLLDNYEDAQEGGDSAAHGGKDPAAMITFDPVEVPSLTHTKLRKASFSGRELSRPNWNELVRSAIETGLDRFKSLDELLRVTDARIVKGTKTDEGFSPLASRGISVQGVDAHDAWRIAYGLARKLSLPIEVIFEWRDKEGAAHPGEIGTIGWKP